MPAIKVENLRKYFGRTRAVDGISFNVKKGEIMGFLGPNGAGKSTTINCMMDILRPDQGKIEIMGLDAREFSPQLKEKIGYLSEEANLYPDWTGQEHINLLKSIRNGQRIDESELIKQLSFEPKKRVKNLSFGNRQKLGLILALIHQPEILILDEPTRGLDPLLQQNIYELLSSRAFLSSHNLPEVERICDRVSIIKEGKIVAVERIAQLRKKRIYTISVRFKEPVSRDRLRSKGVEIKGELEDGYILKAHSEIRPLLESLLRFKLKNIEIQHSSLEEIFMEYYK